MWNLKQTTKLTETETRRVITRDCEMGKTERKKNKQQTSFLPPFKNVILAIWQTDLLTCLTF